MSAEVKHRRGASLHQVTITVSCCVPSITPLRSNIPTTGSFEYHSNWGRKWIPSIAHVCVVCGVCACEEEDVTHDN